MDTNRPASLALRGLLGLFAAFVALVALAGPAASQDGLAITGTARDANREPVEGIELTVTQDGEVIGQATTDAEGQWEVPVPGNGVYLVAIDVDSIPAGVSLRDPDVTEREVEIEGRSKAALFALEGAPEGVEVEGAIGANAGDGTFARYLDRFMSGIRVGSLVALAAVGLSLIYGVTSIVNFAHAEMVGFGAVVTWWIEDATGMPLIAALFLGVIAGGVLGFVLERGLFAPLRSRKLSLISLMVVSIGLAVSIVIAFAVNDTFREAVLGLFS